VGLLNLHVLDAADRPQATEAVQLLIDSPIGPDTRFFYYALYYATQAAHQVGGPAWEAVWTNARQRLLEMQQADGGWPISRSSEEPGRIYATSMSLLTLSVPYRLLPIYQR
jgi:hypothetical protein